MAKTVTVTITDDTAVEALTALMAQALEARARRNGALTDESRAVWHNVYRRSIDAYDALSDAYREGI